MTAAEANTTQDASSGAPHWAKLVLASAAAIELVGGLNDLPILFGDMSEIPGPGPSGWLIKAHIALGPVFALAALVFAARGRMRPALVAMAAVVLMTWLNYLPSVAVHGLEFAGDGAGGLLTLFQVVLAPMLAVAVSALALRGTRLGLATALAVLPTVFAVVFFMLFAVGVAIYGF